MKIYEKVKGFMKGYYLYVCFYFVFLACLLCPLPYYIYSGGGIIPVDSKIEISSSYDSKGSFNLCYVSERNATVSSFLLAKILPGWDLVKMEDVSLSENETADDVFMRDRVILHTGNTNAIEVAYQKAGKTFSVTGTKNYVLYISEEAVTGLKIGDDVRKINGKEITSLFDIKEEISKGSVGESVSFTVLRKGKEVEVEAVVYEEDGASLIGVMIQSDYEYETDPSIELHFKENEAGSSGGLLLSLSIYNQLVEKDITHGLKIAGTGTMERGGYVGEIAGVKYKIQGAVRAKADVFLVPKGDNYKEALEEVKKHNYKIQVIGVETFDEALDYLEMIS